jgi:hypothetical protein
MVPSRSDDLSMTLRHTWLTFGSKLLSNPSRNLQCRYIAVRPGCSVFGRVTEYGDPWGGEAEICLPRSAGVILYEPWSTNLNVTLAGAKLRSE